MTFNAPALDDVRQKIDDIDNDIVSLLRKRMHLVHEVGKRKHAAGMSGSYIRSGREASMLRRLSEKLDGVLTPRAVVGIWRVIIASSLSAEKAFTVYAGPSEGNAAYWLGMEYFGGIIPVAPTSSNEEVVKSIEKDPMAVGVACVSSEDRAPWWLRPPEEKNNLYVFAALPFAGGAALKAPETFAFANITPEKTDSDATLIAISHQPHHSSDVKALCDSGKARIHADIPCGTLFSVDEYVTHDHSVAENIRAQLPDGATMRILGHYAVPIAS